MEVTEGKVALFSEMSEQSELSSLDISQSLNYLVIKGQAIVTLVGVAGLLFVSNL